MSFQPVCSAPFYCNCAKGVFHASPIQDADSSDIGQLLRQDVNLLYHVIEKGNIQFPNPVITSKSFSYLEGRGTYICEFNRRFKNDAELEREMSLSGKGVGDPFYCTYRVVFTRTAWNTTATFYERPSHQACARESFLSEYKFYVVNGENEKAKKIWSEREERLRSYAALSFPPRQECSIS